MVGTAQPPSAAPASSAAVTTPRQCCPRGLITSVLGGIFMLASPAGATWALTGRRRLDHRSIDNMFLMGGPPTIVAGHRAPTTQGRSNQTEFDQLKKT